MIHVRSQHDCTGEKKTTQTPGDCRPAYDIPCAATRSLRDGFQRALPKHRGENLQAKNKKITQQAKRCSKRKGKGEEQHAGGSCGVFSLMSHHFTAVQVGRCCLQSESELLLELLLECWRRQYNFKVAQKQPSVTPFLVHISDPGVGARSQGRAASRLSLQQRWLQTRLSPGAFAPQQKGCPQVCRLAGLRAGN